MSEEKSTFETKNVPSVYCNQAYSALSFNEIRVYLAEVSPNELVVNPSGAEIVQKQPNQDLKFSLILTPEFARSLANAIATTVTQYEQVFGKLRPEPTKEQVTKAFAKK